MLKQKIKFVGQCELGEENVFFPSLESEFTDELNFITFGCPGVNEVWFYTKIKKEVRLSEGVKI